MSNAPPDSFASFVAAYKTFCEARQSQNPSQMSFIAQQHQQSSQTNNDSTNIDQDVQDVMQARTAQTRPPPGDINRLLSPSANNGNRD